MRLVLDFNPKGDAAGGLVRLKRLILLFLIVLIYLLYVLNVAA